MNRILLLGGGGLVAGAIVIALMAPRFNALGLMINLAAIALGLLMGKGLGRLIYRRAGNPATLSNDK